MFLCSMIFLSIHKKFLSEVQNLELNEIKYDKSRQQIKFYGNFSKKLIGEIYDTVSYTSTFLNFIKRKN